MGIETFDPRRAYATSPARDFAWYFTVNDPGDTWGRTQHVLFVVTAPWTPPRTRDFLFSYVVMPGAAVSEVGRPWFTFYAAHEPPFAVRYLFSNSAPGALEAAILSEMGGADWSAPHLPHRADEVRALLQRLELATETELASRCPEVLDGLFASLPRPGPDESPGVFGRDYAPEGTLIALGVLVGESLREALGGGARWEADPNQEFPSLRVRAPADGILRPIGVLRELYGADADLLPSEYCRRVLVNLGVSGLWWRNRSTEEVG